MTPAGAFTVAPDHPSLAGHFPGRPVTPGVLLLDLVCAAILDAHPGRRVARFPSVKFLRPVLPGEAVQVEYGPGRDGRLAFVCTVDAAVAVRGMLVLA